MSQVTQPASSISQATWLNNPRHWQSSITSPSQFKTSTKPYRGTKDTSHSRMPVPASSLTTTDPDNHIFPLYGPSLHKVKIAWLSYGNVVGLELFELIEPRCEAPAISDSTFDLQDRFKQDGFFHICLTVPDPANTAEVCAKDGVATIGERMAARGESG